MPRAPSFTRQTAASSAPAASAPADSADGACVGGKSLSGISVTTQCVTLFEQLKSKGAYKFLTFKIDPSGAKVVPDQCGPANSSFSDFTDALPESDCRYAVYDCEYVNADGCQFKKLIFVLWSPDNSQIKAKMMYASTKDFLKGLFPGIAIEQQATDISEVDAEEMRLKIQATLTRK
jgi:cofilin